MAHPDAAGRRAGPRPPPAPGGRALEIAEDARVARAELAVDALLVERLQQARGRLAERGGLADQHGNGLGDTPGAKQRGAGALLSIGGEIGKLLPERGAIVG